MRLCLWAVLFGEHRELAAVKGLAGAVLSVLLLFADTVFPLVSVFVLLPAGAAAGAKVEPVRVANAIAIVDDLAASLPVEDEFAVVVEEIFSLDEANEVSCCSFLSAEAAGVCLSALTSVVFVSGFLIKGCCLLVKGFVMNDVHDLNCVFR